MPFFFCNFVRKCNYCSCPSWNLLSNYSGEFGPSIRWGSQSCNCKICVNPMLRPKIKLSLVNTGLKIYMHINQIYSATPCPHLTKLSDTDPLKSAHQRNHMCYLIMVQAQTQTSPLDHKIVNFYLKCRLKLYLITYTVNILLHECCWDGAIAANGTLAGYLGSKMKCHWICNWFSRALVLCEELLGTGTVWWYRCVDIWIELKWGQFRWLK